MAPSRQMYEVDVDFSYTNQTSNCYYGCSTSPPPPPMPSLPPPPSPPLPLLLPLPSAPPPTPAPIPSILPQKTPPFTPIILDRDHKSGVFHNHTTLALTLLACIFLLSLLSTAVLLFFYRRSRRRRALAAGFINTPLFPSDPPPDPTPDQGPDPEGDDPIHHVWYIRTIGLDEATIESIAVTQYRAGSGLLGSADCSVCLGDFQDGDSVRLLPKCGHAFHVPCIDTWLRAHVNCPVCRSHVVDPAVTAVVGDSTSATSEASAGDTEETGSEARESGDVSLDEEESRDGEENEHAQEVFVEIPLSDSAPNLPDHAAQTEPEAREPVRHRSASVDSPFMIPSVVIMIPEKEQSGKEKERPGNGSKAGSTRFEMVRSLSSTSSGSGRAFFFSRNGRSRNSVLPL